MKQQNLTKARILIVPIYSTIKTKIGFHLLVHQLTWLLNYWADLLKLVVLEDRSLITPDKRFYTFYPPPLFLFLFCCQHMSQSGFTHTAQTSHSFLLLCKPDPWVIFLRLDFWQTTEIMVSLCRNANEASWQSTAAQSCMIHRCCG